MIGAGFNRGDDFEKVTIPDKVLDRMSGYQNFAFRDANFEIGAEAQPLCDNPHQDSRLTVLPRRFGFRRESGNHPLQRLGASRRVNGGHDQVAGLRMRSG